MKIFISSVLALFVTASAQAYSVAEIQQACQARDLNFPMQDAIVEQLKVIRGQLNRGSSGQAGHQINLLIYVMQRCEAFAQSMSNYGMIYQKLDEIRRVENVSTARARSLVNRLILSLEPPTND